jgi:hypothetical protein
MFRGFIEYRDQGCQAAKDQREYIASMNETHRAAQAEKMTLNPTSIANSPDHPDRYFNLKILHEREKRCRAREADYRKSKDIRQDHLHFLSGENAFKGLVRDDWVNENLEMLNIGIIWRPDSPERPASPEKFLTPAAKRQRASRYNLKKAGKDKVRARSNDRRKAKRKAQRKIRSPTPGAVKRKEQREREAARGPKKLPMTPKERKRREREKKALETKSRADTTVTTDTR